jgi:hypothetical protein
LKRQLVHVGDFNLSLVLRQMLGAGTPRELKNRFGKLFMAMLWLFWRGNPQQCIPRSRILAFAANYLASPLNRLHGYLRRKSTTCTTGC